MTTNENKNGIFINGKQQIIEMLQYMSSAEKDKLLDNISQRNAVMARELREKSFSFHNLSQLPDPLLRDIFEKLNPTIVGLALHSAPVAFQRQVLALISRPIAEEAFSIINQDLTTKKMECKRAQEKVIQVAVQLSRRHMINL